MKFWLVGKDLPHCAGARVQVYGTLLNAMWMAYDSRLASREPMQDVDLSVFRVVPDGVQPVAVETSCEVVYAPDRYTARAIVSAEVLPGNHPVFRQAAAEFAAAALAKVGATDQRLLHAVDLAAAYARGEVSAAELEAAHAAATEAVNEILARSKDGRQPPWVWRAALSAEQASALGAARSGAVLAALGAAINACEAGAWEPPWHGSAAVEDRLSALFDSASPRALSPA